MRVAIDGQALERRTTGVAQTEHARALVEGLAGGVVERASEDLEAVVLLDTREQRMPAAGDQAHERRLERLAICEEVSGHMPLEVVDGGERQLPRGGDRLRRREADEQRAHEPGALGGGDELHALEARSRLLERLRDDRVHQLEVVARGDLGDYAAEGDVRLLGGDHVGEHLPTGVDHRRARVVAACLQGKDRHTEPGFGTSSRDPASVAGVRHMTSASSPLSW